MLGLLDSHCTPLWRWKAIYCTSIWGIRKDQKFSFKFHPWFTSLGYKLGEGMLHFLKSSEALFAQMWFTDTIYFFLVYSFFYFIILCFKQYSGILILSLSRKEGKKKKKKRSA